MVARGSMGSVVGISTGCRRYLRRRRWHGWKGEAGRKRRRATELEGSESSKGVEPFLGLRSRRVLRNRLFLTPVQLTVKTKDTRIRSALRASRSAN